MSCEQAITPEVVADEELFGDVVSSRKTKSDATCFKIKPAINRDILKHSCPEVL